MKSRFWPLLLLGAAIGGAAGVWQGAVVPWAAIGASFGAAAYMAQRPFMNDGGGSSDEDGCGEGGDGGD